MSQTLSRKVSILLSGSVVAQALPLLAAPLLARLYSPESFGEFGLYVAVTSILGAIANLKYDHAVLLAKNAVAAFHMFVICVVSSATMAILLSLVIILAPETMFGSRWFSVNRSHALLLPISFLLASLTLALTSILFRGEQFGNVAKVRVSQAALTTVLSILFGYWMPTGTLLIGSAIVGQCFGVALLFLMRDSNQIFFTSLRLSLLVSLIKRYRRFPVFTAPSDLLNALGTNLPLLFIGSIYGVATAGAYTLAQRTLGSPLMLIGSAFSDAYRQSAAKSFAEDGSYWRVSVRTFRTLGSIAILPVLICAVYSPMLFTIVFGNEWALTGDIVQILVWVYFFRFVVSPLSYNFYLANRHSEDLMLQCLGFISTVVLFKFAENSLMSFSQFLPIYSAFFCGIYFIYGIRSLKFARASINKI